MAFNVNNLKEYDKINVPNNTDCQFQYSIDDTTYDISLFYDKYNTCWYIGITIDNENSYKVRLTINKPLFIQNRHTMPHCFFCTTTTGLSPMQSNAFEKQGTSDENIEATLYCCKWEDYIDNILNNDD